MSSLELINKLIDEYNETGVARPTKLIIEDSDLLQLIRLRGNPRRFTPHIFEAGGVLSGQHPVVGEARLLRIISDLNGDPRAIIRQGRSLYVYPHF